MAASAAVFVVLIFGVGISAWQALRATRAERKQSELAGQATRAQEREAKQRSISEKRLYDLLFSVANSKSHERRAGYRNEVFQHLRQAATLDVPEKDPLALRDVAMLCLGDVAGLSPVLITNFPADIQIEDFRIDPSGQIGAFGLSDWSIQLRRLPSGEELERLNLTGEQPAPRWMRFIFSEDGQQLASLYGMPDRSQNIVCLWARGNNDRWGKLTTVPTPHANNLGMLNGRPFVCTYDKSARVERAVELETGKVIAQLTNSTPAAWLNYTTSGLLIMVTRDPGLTVHVWNAREGRKLPEIRPKLEGSQCIPSVSKDGRLLICIGRTGAEIYSLPQLERVLELQLPPRMLNRRPAAFARNNAWVGIASEHRRIDLWDWANQRQVFTFDDVDTEVGLQFTADDKYLVAIGNRQATLYPLSGQSERTVVSNRKPAKHMVGFSPDSRRFGSVCGDGQLVVGDVWTGQSLWETNATEGQAGGKLDDSFVSFRPDGLMAVSSHFELPPKLAQAEVGAKTNAVVASVSKGELAFWSEQRRLRLVNASTQVTAFVVAPQFTPDGRFLLAIGGEDRAGNDRGYVWRVNRAFSEPSADSLELENVMTTDASSGPQAVHNQHFAYVKWATNGAPEIHLVELEGQRIDRILRRGALDRGGLQRLGFTPDGRQLLVVNTNYEIVALDIVTGEAVTPPIKPRMVPGADNRKGVNISLSPDGSKLAVFVFMSPGAGVEIWDWKARQYLYSLPEPSSSVFNARWSPDSQHLAVGSFLETSIWHLALVERALADLGLFADAPSLSSPGGNPHK